jgi:hypothetical protein
MPKRSRKEKIKSTTQVSQNVIPTYSLNNTFELTGKTSTTRSPSKTEGHDAKKYVGRDISRSALVALLIVVILIILYFTIR